MAKIKPERAAAKEEISSFAGMGGHASPNGNAAADCCNFRICGDGSLEKRSGWSVKREFMDPVQAVWVGTVGGERLHLVVSGDIVFLVQDGYNKNVGILTGIVNDVHFLHYGDALYLLTGSQIWVWRSNLKKMEKVVPYVPLFGHNWHPTSYGDVNEPINLLTRCLRVHYRNTTATASFMLPFFAESVEMVRVDGKSVTDFYLHGGGDMVQIPSAANGTVVEVAFTMAYSTDLADQLASCTKGFVSTDDGEESAFLFGASQGYRLFPSRTVTTSMKNYCHVFYPTVDPVYFCEDDLLNPGDAQNPIRALCRQYGRLMIFCDHGVHWAERDKEIGLWQSYPLFSGIGCAGESCVIPYEQDLLVFQKGGLYRMNATASNPESARLTCLSGEVAEHLAEMTTDICMWLERSRQEVWIRDPKSNGSTVWVYHIPEKKWYRFDGIPASFFLEWDGDVGFAWNRFLCLMREEDVTDNGSPFTAYYQSGYSPLVTPQKVKRTLRAVLWGATADNLLRLHLQTEQRSKELLLQGSNREAPHVFDCRVSLGRFRFLRYRLTVTGVSRPRIYGISFYSNL